MRLEPVAVRTLLVRQVVEVVQEQVVDASPVHLRVCRWRAKGTAARLDVDVTDNFEDCAGGRREVNRNRSRLA